MILERWQWEYLVQRMMFHLLRQLRQKPWYRARWFLLTHGIVEQGGLLLISESGHCDHFHNTQSIGYLCPEFFIRFIMQAEIVAQLECRKVFFGIVGLK